MYSDLAPTFAERKPIAAPWAKPLLGKGLANHSEGHNRFGIAPTPKRQLMSQRWLLFVIGEIAFSLSSVLWCEEDRTLIAKDDLTCVLVNCAPACYIAMSSSEVAGAARDINTIGIYR